MEASLQAALGLDEAIVAVAVCAALYTAAIQAGAWIGLRSALAETQASGVAPWLELSARGISLDLFCLFMATSAFNNVGLCLLSASAAGLANNPAALLVLAGASVAGNTGWPILLRAMLWLGGASLPAGKLQRGCAYALVHPQRCYHLLFGRRETTCLTIALFLTNAGQMALLRHTAAVAVQARFVPELFFAINTRSTGLALADLNLLAPSVLVVTAFAMWWSPYPLVVLWAQADEGEIFKQEASSDSASPPPSGPAFPAFESFLKLYLRRHALWLWVALLTLTLVDEDLLRSPDSPTSIFAYAFEILSAYGTNGLSMGHPAAGNASLCAVMHPVSKLTLVALMLLGRHRFMPRAIDATLEARIADARAMVEAAQMELAAREAGPGGEAGLVDESPAAEAAEEGRVVRVDSAPQLLRRRSATS